MIPYLLPAALLLGVVDPQTANETERSRPEGNRTLTWTTDNGTTTLSNVTFSLSQDQLRDIEKELETNQTSDVITVEDENFPEYEDSLPDGRCHADVLVKVGHSICGDIFYQEMLSMDTDDWCVLEKVLRPYNDMSVCLERVSNLVGCFYPNPNIQDIFLHMHQHFFHNCSKEEHHLEDAPQWLVILLTLVPVGLIPVLVYVVVWKSKVPE